MKAKVATKVIDVVSRPINTLTATRRVIMQQIEVLCTKFQEIIIEQ
jgi:hypothetical protein